MDVVYMGDPVEPPATKIAFIGENFESAIFFPFFEIVWGREKTR